MATNATLTPANRSLTLDGGFRPVIFRETSSHKKKPRLPAIDKTMVILWLAIDSRKKNRAITIRGQVVFLMQKAMQMV